MEHLHFINQQNTYEAVMRLEITCPTCGDEFDLGLARNDDDWRELVELVLSLPDLVHRPMWQYLSLFQGKQKLRSLKMLRIVKELQPLIKAAAIKRGHETYAVPAEQFAKAMTYLVDTRPPSLVLPLKGNGYLLGLLANRADQAIGKNEKQHEHKLRNRKQTKTTGNASHAMYVPGQNQTDDSTFINPAESLNPNINKPTKES